MLLGLAVVVLYGIPLLTGTPPLLAVPGQAAGPAAQQNVAVAPNFAADASGNLSMPLVVETAEEAEAVAGRHLARNPAGPGQPLRVQLPRLGMDIPVLPMSLPADRRVNPPSNGFAYWITDFGPAGAAAANTTYVAAHSWNLGYAAFNGLMDIRAGAGRVQAGDSIFVTTPEGVTRYTVTSAGGHAKATLKDEDDLWAAVPGRLVLVTCFQLNDAGATENYVVYAERAG